MRRAIGIIGLLLALFIALIRASYKPIFADNAAYTYLLGTGGSTIEIIITRILLLTLLILLVQLLIKKNTLPAETIIVFIATPAILTSLVTAGNNLLLGALGALSLIIYKNKYALVPIAILFPLVAPEGVFFSGLIGILLILRKDQLPGTVAILGGTLITILTKATIGATPYTQFQELAGLSLFLFLLAMTGVVLLWRKNTYTKLLIALTVIVLGQLYQELNILVAITVSILGGYALNILRTREWKLESIKTISIFLAIMGLLFTAAATAGEAIRAEPNQDLYEASHIAKEFAGTNEQVFVLNKHKDAFAWQGVPVTSENQKILLTTRNIDEFNRLTPRYLILAESDETPNIEFLKKNTDNFKILHEGYYTVYEVTI